MAEFTSQGQGTLNTVLGALGTAAFTGIGNGNGLNLFGGGKVEYATKSDLDNAILLAAKDSEIALLKADQNTEVKIADVYSRLKGDMLTLERNQHDWNTQQALNNCQMSSAIAANRNSIDILMGMTKTVIPNSSVCPGWDSASTTPAPTT